PTVPTCGVPFQVKSRMVHSVLSDDPMTLEEPIGLECLTERLFTDKPGKILLASFHMLSRRSPVWGVALMRPWIGQVKGVLIIVRSHCIVA
ncbi:hypothetical protein QML37_30865, partial [Klebsiella pneumoniae]|uniref:hypothetical protein n=1 Tax=Klebsiella pneumoniae TaxID=573 RepID=UPI003A7F79E0